MSEPIQIEKDKTYVLEVDHVMSSNHVRSIIKDFKEATGSNVIVLNGARLARVASEAEQAIERVRELHKPVAGIGITECAVCVDDRMHWTESVEYPCPTIKALDGEQ